MIIFRLLPIDKVELELLLPADPGRLLERTRRRPRGPSRGCPSRGRAAAARGGLLPVASEVARVVHHGLALTLDPGKVPCQWEFDQSTVTTV